MNIASSVKIYYNVVHKGEERTASSPAVLYAQPREASTSVGIIEMPSEVQATGCSAAIALPEEIKKVRQNQKLKLLLLGLINEE
jgi:hypothetical protein